MEVCRAFTATRNHIFNNGFPPVPRFAKGYVEVSLSRKMVDFMINELHLTELFWRVNNGRHGGDEIWIPTLQATEALNVPGGFMYRCVEEVGGNSHFTRSGY
uniref:Uncharacterized protein n=1 Tax=Panagrolaimus sp. ES5 TaxID=591445 RepID=A0AC34FLQ6_9BILA